MADLFFYGTLCHVPLLERVLGRPAAEIALSPAVLPGWAWHVGHGARGIFPYASLHPKCPAGDGSEPRAEATAPTVPLALLQALVKALLLKD